MKTKTKSKTTPQAKKSTLVVFLLDRTGSMSACKAETISGFNAYIDELKKLKDSVRFTLVQFDSQGIDTLHDAVKLDEVDRLTDKTYEPRAATPLYDAMGKTIHGVKEGAAKVLFVSLTDGEENASSEYSFKSVNALIKEKEKANWTFAHIGVGLAGWATGNQIYAGTQSLANNLKSSHKDTKVMYDKLARATFGYATSASGQCVSTKFWAGKDEDEEEA